MADDLACGRRTEIDMLCGEIVRLAQSLGRTAPLNARMVELLAGPAPCPIGGRELRRRLGL
jgi:2-dehydropantoate 2-reductase